VCEEPNAISLASSDAQGRPSVRVVLLKGFDKRGFIFYTNYNSRKGSELAATGAAAFSVYWEQLQRQVRFHFVVNMNILCLSHKTFFKVGLLITCAFIVLKH